MWRLTFETRLPVGLGPRVLKWENERLPTSNDILELISLDAGSYWFTLKAGGAESPAMDFVPLIILMDKHRGPLSTCTIKVGHRNPFQTSAEAAETANKLVKFVQDLERSSDANNKVSSAASPDVQKSKDTPKADDIQAPASSGTKTAKQAISTLTSATTHNESDSDSEAAEGWVDAIKDQPEMSPALQRLMASSDASKDWGEIKALRDRINQRVMEWANESPAAPAASTSGPVAAADDAKEPFDSQGSEPPFKVDDLIVCRMPLRPQQEETDETKGAGTDTTKVETKDKGKGKAKARPSYGLTLEDGFESGFTTRDATPAPEGPDTGPDTVLPTPTHTMSPTTQARVRNSFFEELVADANNTAASARVLDIIQKEQVGLDTSLGIKLLDLAKSLRKGGDLVSGLEPSTAAPAKENSWGTMMHRQEGSIRMLEKVLDRLNEHSGMLNAIAEASGVNLLDDDAEEQTDQKAAAAPTASAQSAASPQEALRSLLDNAYRLPGSTGPMPPVPPAHPIQGVHTSPPFIAICPPHPSAMARPEEQMRPLPDTTPNAAASSPPVTAAPAPAPTGLGETKPSDVHDSIWNKVQDFAKTSAAARAKAEKEQQEALQAHILDMYRLSKSVSPATKEEVKAEPPIAGTSNSTTHTSANASASASANEKSSPSLYRNLGLNESLDAADPKAREDYDYERYKHYTTHGPFADASYQPEPRFFRFGPPFPNAYGQAFRGNLNGGGSAFSNPHRGFHPALSPGFRPAHLPGSFPPPHWQGRPGMPGTFVGSVTPDSTAAFGAHGQMGGFEGAARGPRVEFGTESPLP